MCPPALIAITTMAVSGLQAVASYSAAQAKYRAEQQQYNQNYQNALASNRDNENQLTLRQMQEQDATKQKDHQQLVAGAQKQAEVQVSAAGGNVAGISVDNLTQDVARAVDNNRTNLETNWMNTAQQLQSQKDGDVVKTKGRIDSVAQPSEPSPAGALLGFAGSALGSAAKLDIGFNSGAGVNTGISPTSGAAAP